MLHVMLFLCGVGVTLESNKKLTCNFAIHRRLLHPHGLRDAQWPYETKQSLLCVPTFSSLVAEHRRLVSFLPSVGLLSEFFY